MNDTPKSQKSSQSAELTCYIADSQKLVTLADSCSDVLYGGESGWERIDFKQFVADCRKAIAFGVRCKVAGLSLFEKTEVKKPAGSGGQVERLVSGRAWYGPGGSLLTDKPICDLPKLPQDAADYYGAPYLIAESMTEDVAIKISKALGLDFKGVTNGGPFCGNTCTDCGGAGNLCPYR